MKGTSPGSWLGGRGERDANRYVGGKKKGDHTGHHVCVCAVPTRPGHRSRGLAEESQDVSSCGLWAFVV